MADEATWEEQTKDLEGFTQRNREKARQRYERQQMR